MAKTTPSTNKLAKALAELDKAEPSRRPTLKMLVAENYELIEALLPKHTFQRIVEIFVEHGREISVSSLTQYFNAEKRSRAVKPGGVRAFDHHVTASRPADKLAQPGTGPHQAQSERRRLLKPRPE
jgi:hypothetical protein